MLVNGRVLASGEPRSYRSQWPGVYYETAFRGDAVFIRIVSGEARLKISVDDRTVSVSRPEPGAYRIEAQGSGDHRLRVEIASEDQATPFAFGGVYGHPAAPAQRRSRQVEFIGDSHTVGYGNTSPDRTCTVEQLWQTTDTGAGLAGQLAARFGADYQVNAISGRGIVRNYNGSAGDPVPQAYPYILFDRQHRYEDPDWRPQAVAISLGNNDFSTPLQPGERWTSREQLTADVEASYTAFVQAVRARNPSARILLWGTEGGEMAAAGRTVVAQLTALGDGRIQFVPVDGLTRTGCDYHPGLEDDRMIAEALAAVIADDDWSVGPRGPTD